MPNYINTSTGKYPVSEQEIRDEFPNTIFPEPFAPDGFAVVFPTPAPQYDPLTHGVREAAPVQTSKGHYEQAWEVVDLPADVVAENVERRKQELIDAANSRRNELETAGFTHDGHRFQSDERSVARLSNSAQTALAAVIQGGNPQFPDWMTEDNQPYPVDARGMIALQASLTQHAGALHAHSRELKILIQAATTAADLESIDITAGWPA